jgi:hypothetical protein
MAQEDEPRSGEEIREHEREARQREAAAEGVEAQRQRDSEVSESREPGARDPDEDSVVPMDADEQRQGVMRPPEGA